MDDLRISRFDRLKGSILDSFPILQWLPSYGVKDVFGDFVAGISVALAAIPQSMAYAVLAGIRPQYGLYSSFLAPFLYIFLGSCRQVTVGPTAVSALLAYETCGSNFPDCVILVAFYSGIVQIVLTVLRLGSLVALISDPVTLGFTSGAALTIASSQLKSFLGFTSSKDTKFIGYLMAIFENWASISIPDVTMGVSSLLGLLILQKFHQLIATGGYEIPRDHILGKFLFAMSVSRNVIVVATASLIAFYWGSTPPFKLTGFVEPGLPNITLPKFSLPNRWDNVTVPLNLTFQETLTALGTGPSLVALVAILQNVAISKAYGSGQRINGNQEMLSLGVISILGGFISAQPVSASFSRSALNDASGVRSQFSGFFTGTAIIMSLLFFTPVFFYIPRATLAAVIISAVSGMLQFRVLFQMWKVSRIDTLTYAVTFLSSLLLSMELGIGIGVGFSILAFLYKFVWAKLLPEFKNDEEDPLLEYVILRPPHGLHFPDVDTLRKYVNHYSVKYSPTHPVVVLDCLKWLTFDFTGVSAIGSLIRATERNGTFLVLLHCSPEIQNALKQIGITPDELLRITCDSEAGLSGLVKKLRNELIGCDN